MKRIFGILLLTVIVVLALNSCSQPPVEEKAEFTFSQVGEEQRVLVKWEANAQMKRVEVIVKHGDRVVSKTTVEGDMLSHKSVEVDAYYGKHTVSVNATFDSGKNVSAEKELALSASEYNVAPISGSMPQLYFTLYMNEITRGGEIPTFVWLARPDSWNWTNLPENVYAMPTVDIDEVLTHNNYDRMVEVADAYIEELYSINPNAKFNLYINDYNSYLYLKLLVANGIPEENYYVTLLSDGGGSYSAFNDAFNSEDPEFDAYAKYDEMADLLDVLYGEVADAKDYNWTGAFSVNTSEFNSYAYVAAKEKDNVEWWILRPRTGVLCSPDEEFINMVLNDDKKEGVIEERNFASPLNAMSDDEKTALKALYNFNDEMFEEAEEQGKSAMMILGSWANAENEPDFEAYVKLIKAYYGDEFVYYYKGHPNTPTSLYPDKQAQLEELGLIDVESSINAELILFFYPDIYMCGYNSSTFMSVESPEMACAMFNMKKADCTAEYSGLIGVYLSKIDDHASSEYAELCPEAEHTYFLMEYNDTTEKDIGIYDATADTFAYYKIVDGEFVEVVED